jgi:hypothetical protein
VKVKGHAVFQRVKIIEKTFGRVGVKVKGHAVFQRVKIIEKTFGLWTF